MDSSISLLLRDLALLDQPVARSRLFSLSELRSSDLSDVDSLWSAIPPSTRRSVVRSLVELSETILDADFVLFFRYCLNDADPDVRADAIEGLWESDDAWMVGALSGILQWDESEIARASAASSLGRFVLLGELGDMPAAVAARAEQALLAAWSRSDETVRVRRRVLESIAYSGEQGVEDLIREAYHGDDQDMRASALCAMGRSANRTWRSVLKDALENASAALRYEATVACGELELRDAVEPLTLLVQDADSEVRGAAAEALGKIGGKVATRVLQVCCDADDETLSSAARDALETMAWHGETRLDVQDDWSLRGANQID